MRAFAGRAALIAFAILCAIAPPRALAWSVLPCTSDPQQPERFPNGNAWPLQFLANMPAGDPAQTEALAAFDSWNSIYGALDELSKTGDGASGCFPPTGGPGYIGWDDGTCTTWEPNEAGVTLTWSNGCEVSNAVVYVNTSAGLIGDSLRATLAHELGHYQTYAHNWNDVSIMGYTYSNTPPMTYLQAQDQDFLRHLYPSGKTAGTDLYIDRYVATSPIVPDMLSYQWSAEARCTHGCANLRATDEIRVQATYGNAGGSATSGPVDFEVRLGATVIGTYQVAALAAGAQATYEFVGTIPMGIPAGKIGVDVVIDPKKKYTHQGGPTGPALAHFDGLSLRAPSSWTCLVQRYGLGDGCDCGCGDVDPDCARSNIPVRGCTNADPCKDLSCSPTGTCQLVNNTRLCDDGKWCTENDTCGAGVCTGTARSCATATACMIGRCDESAKACAADPDPKPECAASTGGDPGSGCSCAVGGRGELNHTGAGLAFLVIAIVYRRRARA